MPVSMPLVPEAGCDPSPQSIVVETIVPLESLQLADAETVSKDEALCTVKVHVGPCGLIPTPLKRTFCGLPGALSDITSISVPGPGVTGLNVT
jgi:hypothetical protein